MINIPIEIGDIILTGRFKNKKITVKEIGIDEYGSPTINGRSVLKIRIPKLYKKIMEITETNSEQLSNLRKVKDELLAIVQPLITKKKKLYSKIDISSPMSDDEKLLNNEIQKIFSQINDIVHQIRKLNKLDENKLNKLIRKVITELELTDPDMIRKAKEYAMLAEKMDRLKAEMSALKKQFDPLDDEFINLIDAIDETKERSIRAENVLITIKKKGYEAKSPSYKEAFDLLYSKVNGKIKTMADECLTAATTMKKVSSSLATQTIKGESKLNEAGLLNNIWNKVKNFINKFTSKITSIGQSVDQDLDKLEQLANK